MIKILKLKLANANGKRADIVDNIVMDDQVKSGVESGIDTKRLAVAENIMVNDTPAAVAATGITPRPPSTACGS